MTRGPMATRYAAGAQKFHPRVVRPVVSVDRLPAVSLRAPELEYKALFVHLKRTLRSFHFELFYGTPNK
jgi:hypothetical protein